MSTPTPALSSKHQGLLLCKPKGALRVAAKKGTLKQEILALVWSKFTDVSTRAKDPALYVYLCELIQEGWKDDAALSPAENDAHRAALLKEIVLALFPEAEAFWPECEALIAFVQTNALPEPVGCLRRTSAFLGRCVGRSPA